SLRLRARSSLLSACRSSALSVACRVSTRNGGPVGPSTLTAPTLILRRATHGDEGHLLYCGGACVAERTRGSSRSRDVGGLQRALGAARSARHLPHPRP